MFYPFLLICISRLGKKTLILIWKAKIIKVKYIEKYLKYLFKSKKKSNEITKAGILQPEKKSMKFVKDLFVQ